MPRLFRFAGLLAAAWSAMLMTACSGEPNAGANENARQTPKLQTALDWRGGDEHSFIVHRFDQEVLRCWNVQGKYDCLVAQSIGLKEMIPGAPGRLAFFRFRADALPSTQEAIDGLASSDGYACELTTLPGRTVMTETFWQGGRIIHNRASNLDAGGGWTVADVRQFATGANAGIARSFFACPAVIAPIRDVGLYAVDSGLISYDRIFSAVDYPDRADTNDTGTTTSSP